MLSMDRPFQCQWTPPLERRITPPPPLMPPSCFASFLALKVLTDGHTICFVSAQCALWEGLPEGGVYRPFVLVSRCTGFEALLSMSDGFQIATVGCKSQGIISFRPFAISMYLVYQADSEVKVKNHIPLFICCDLWCCVWPTFKFRCVLNTTDKHFEALPFLEP